MLLPISIVVGLFLVSQGVIQTSRLDADGRRRRCLGPVASQEVIKELGTNGGGFFNVNSALPFENPTWLSNFVEMLLILADPGRADRDLRPHGRQPPPGLGDLRRDAVARSSSASSSSTIAENARRRPRMRRRRRSHGFNMEGKEQRFGIASTALWVAVTTAASCGAVNGAMESLTGIGGAVPMAEMQTGEVIFGGVGSGLYGMLLFVDPRRLPLRPDGRPHARVPRQEDRGARGQARP